LREVAGLTGNGQDAVNAAHLDDFQQELVPIRSQPVGLEPPTQDEMQGSRRARGIQNGPGQNLARSGFAEDRRDALLPNPV
jgi:hypothetical protein